MDGGRDGLEEVVGSVGRDSGRRTHGTDDDDGLVAGQGGIEEECSLLEGVGTLRKRCSVIEE